MEEVFTVSLSEIEGVCSIAVLDTESDVIVVEPLVCSTIKNISKLSVSFAVLTTYLWW